MFIISTQYCRTGYRHYWISSTIVARSSQEVRLFKGRTGSPSNKGCSPWAWYCVCVSPLLLSWLFWQVHTIKHFIWNSMKYFLLNGTVFLFSKKNNIPVWAKQSLFSTWFFNFAVKLKNQLFPQTNNWELCSPVQNSSVLMLNRRVFSGSIICCKSDHKEESGAETPAFPHQ